MPDPHELIPLTQPGQVDRSQVRVKALAVILDESASRHVVFRARNQAGQHFSRPLGGSVELGELTRDAVVREIREELGATFHPQHLLGVVENIFELDGELGHEVDFLYVGRLAEPDVVPSEGRAYVDGDAPGWAEWRLVQGADPSVALFPEQLQGLLEGWLDGGARDPRATRASTAGLSDRDPGG
ncbi:MAG: NUDIX domain-containing protein [Nocardioides sp.]